MRVESSYTGPVCLSVRVSSAAYRRFFCRICCHVKTNALVPQADTLYGGLTSFPKNMIPSLLGRVIPVFGSLRLVA